jgi:hypothetical protein
MSDKNASADCLAQIEEFRKLLGGGTMGGQHLHMSQGGLGYDSASIMSSATVTSSDGRKGQIMFTDRTRDREAASRVSIHEIHVIPNPEEKTPHGFYWHDTGLDMPAGIRIIATWEGWDRSASDEL